MVKKKQPSRFLLILILGLITSVGPFSVDLYLPAFSDIALGLHTDISHVSLSLASYFVGLSAGQLIYGPLLERFGRKKPLYFGMGIHILSSIGCGLTYSIEYLIVFRLFQAIGACAGLVTGRAIVRDFFETREVARVFSLLMAVVAISPIIAPTLGGYISSGLGWRYVFLVLIIIAVLILVLAIIYLPESKEANPEHSLKLKSVFTEYGKIIVVPQFFVYVLTGAISYAGLYAYLSGSPFLYMELLHVSDTEYGWIFAIIAMGLIGANQLNSILLKSHTSERIIQTGLLFQVIIGFFLFYTDYTGQTGVFITTFLIFCYLISLGFIFPNASALSLASMGHTAGNASALMGSIQAVVGALAAAMVGWFQNSTSMPMMVIMAVCALMALVMVRAGRMKWAL